MGGASAELSTQCLLEPIPSSSELIRINRGEGGFVHFKMPLFFPKDQRLEPSNRALAAQCPETGLSGLG